jgi:hypothetical protein
MADALTSGGTEGQPFGYERRLEQKNERIEELEAELDAKRATIDDLRDRLRTAGGHLTFDEYGDGEAGGDGAASDATGVDPSGLAGAEAGGDPGGNGSGGDSVIGAPSDAPEGADPVELLRDSGSGRGVDDDLIDREMERLRRKGERLQAHSAPVPPGADLNVGEMLDLLHAEPVVSAIDAARRDSLCNHESAWSIVAALAAQAPMGLDELARGVPVSTESTGSFLAELHTRSLVVRDEDRRYRLNPAEMRCLTDASANEFARQWDV